MPIFTLPFHSIKKHRASRRQLGTALQMLWVSGVIRPSDVEPRYYFSTARFNAIDRQTERPVAVSLTATSQPSIWQRPIKVDLAGICRWAGILRPSRLQGQR